MQIATNSITKDMLSKAHTFQISSSGMRNESELEKKIKIVSAVVRGHL